MSVKTSKYDFPEHKRGTTFESQTFSLGTIDLTGASILMQFKSSHSSKMIYEFKTIDNSIIITAPLTGTFELQKRILDFPKGAYFYDCLITFLDGEKKVYFEGTQVITDRISE